MQLRKIHAMYRTLFVGLISLALFSCETTTPAATTEEQIVCICGTASADLVGCYCDLCASGDGNPDNPLCTCAPLMVAEETE